MCATPAPSLKRRWLPKRDPQPSNKEPEKGHPPPPTQGRERERTEPITTAHGTEGTPSAARGGREGPPPGTRNGASEPDKAGKEFFPGTEKEKRKGGRSPGGGEGGG